VSQTTNKLAVQRIETIDACNQRVIRCTVRCPHQNQSVPIERCDVCGWNATEEANLRTVECHYQGLSTKPAPTSSADLIGIAEIMSHRVLSATADVSIETLTSVLLDNHIGCVPIVDDRQRPIGMVTKHDLVQFQFYNEGNEEVVVAHRRSHPVGEPGLHQFQVAIATAGQVMLPLAITLSERATVAHAAALMATEGIHHIVVVDLHGKLIGVVSSLDIARWLARNDGYLAADASDA
jgi:CBS domain-containing protein